MTKKEFKKALKRGLGRCILELKHTPAIEKYQDLVLWGCTHNLCYDTQCEGTRAWYLYQLVKCFPDEVPFVKVIINCFNKNCKNWNFSHYCSLLRFFALNGNKEAAKSLWEKYNHLYDILKNRKRRRANGVFLERDDFEELYIELIESSKNSIAVYLKIAEDIGNLYLYNRLYNGFDFEWFYEHYKEKYGNDKIKKIFASQVKNSLSIKKYISEIEEKSEERKRQKIQRLSKEPPTIKELYKSLLKEGNKSSIWISKRIGKEASPKEILIFAQKYISETDIVKK